MITATEARALVNQYNKRIRQEQYERVNKRIIETIKREENRIPTAAKEGLDHCRCEYPNGESVYSIDTIKWFISDYFESYGYKVVFFKSCYWVKW